ncbi:LeoA/HP0731 family dynamin-like GTPase, partial [Pseudomonas aeruginosa]
EQENAETQTIEKYKDITKKYVSEAHLVLYVMNSTNPIKESHKEDLTWLFRTLDLLPRTVFVLSRFDEVADVEDEQDYQANLQ